MAELPEQLLAILPPFISHSTSTNILHDQAQSAFDWRNGSHWITVRLKTGRETVLNGASGDLHTPSERSKRDHQKQFKTCGHADRTLAGDSQKVSLQAHRY